MKNQLLTFFKVRFLCGLALVLALSLGHSGLAQAQAAQAPAYKLSANDRIRVRIVAWDSIQLSFMRFAEIDGDYTVGQDGTVLLPLIGQVQAAGQTPSELAGVMSAVVFRRIGLDNEPSISVEVIEYRPIYVIGDVARPGGYPYGPGMTAIQALAISGGVYRLESRDGNELQQVIRMSGAMRENGLDLLREQMSAARLRAEAAQAEDFPMPEQFSTRADESFITSLYEQEQTLFSSRRETLANARASFSSTRALLETQIKALETKITGLTQQVEVVREAVGNTAELVEKGLARSPNLVLQQRSLLDLESQLLDTETAIFRAQQNIAEIDRDEADLIAARRLQVLNELQQSEANIDRLTVRENVNRQLLQQTDAGTLLAESTATDTTSQIRFRIMRDEGEGQRYITADASTPLLPSDVLEVIREDALLSD